MSHTDNTATQVKARARTADLVAGAPTRPIPGSDDPSPMFTDPSVMMKDPLAVTTAALAKYGSIVHLPAIKSYIVADADFIEEMLTDKESAFSKSPETMDKISPAIGRGLSTLLGDEWRRQRRLANPSFNRHNVHGFVQAFHDCIDEAFMAWDTKDGQEVDVTRDMKRLALRAVIKCLFSTDITKFSDQVTQSLEVLQDFSLLNLWSPGTITPAQRAEFEQARRDIDTIIYGIIAERRAEGAAQRQDLLSMYMSAVYEDTGTGMGDEQLRHEIMNLFLAGHETTANGVAFALHLLATHPETMQRLVEENDRVLAGRPCTAEQLAELAYTERVFKESLRLYPSSWGMSRVNLVPYRFGDFVFPAGSDFIVAQWGLHRSERYWDEPLRFDPDRFLPERIKQQHKFAYMPFGAGARKCIGFYFAEIEGKSILSRVAQRYSLSPSGAPLKLKARLFMTAEPGVRVRIQQR